MCANFESFLLGSLRESGIPFLRMAAVADFDTFTNSFPCLPHRMIALSALWGIDSGAMDSEPSATPARFGEKTTVLPGDLTPVSQEM